MSEPLILKKNETPTYFNKEAAIGFFIGGGPIGALVGGFMGKSRMESEAITGKVIKEPSFWNVDTLLGGLIGLNLGVIAGAITHVALAAAAVATAAPTLTTAAMISATPLALVGLAAIPLMGAAGAALGAYLGGESGMEEMKQEQLQAIAQQTSRAQSYGRAPQQQVEYNHEVSQDHAKKLQEDRARTTQIQLA